MTTFVDAIKVDKLDFRVSYPQRWYDHWRQRDRICLFTGHCCLCHRRTYEFTDGENDPRGALGNHANAALVAEDYAMWGPDIPCCFLCQNDTPERYERALTIAKKQWTTEPN